MQTPLSASLPTSFASFLTLPAQDHHLGSVGQVSDLYFAMQQPGVPRQREKQSPEEKKRKNARSQSDFRRRRKDYVEQLELGIAEASRHLQQLTELHQASTIEVVELRKQNKDLNETVARLRQELSDVRGPMQSPTLAAQPQLDPMVETPFEPSMPLNWNYPSTSYIADDFNLYADADAPTMQCSSIYAPIHPTYAYEGPFVCPIGPPGLTFSPMSAATEQMPSTPPNGLLAEEDWISPDAKSSETALLPAYSDSLRIDPNNLAQLRPASLPTKSAKCSAQLAQMRKLVSEAEMHRLESLDVMKHVDG